ncbi:MAG TPA: hypothetical protein VEU74_12030 [Gemmatimonadales bacterium]|nr:hypothetical protein [Gemmatimonadales bacterium]
MKRATIRTESGDREEQARLRAPETNYFPPERGPFKCSHCRFFDRARSYCTHPKVRADVEPEGCCNRYKEVQ